VKWFNRYADIHSCSADREQREPKAARNLIFRINQIHHHLYHHILFFRLERGDSLIAIGKRMILNYEVQ
jgi:hypothetical protein